MSSARMNALLERAGTQYRVGYGSLVSPAQFVELGEALLERIERLERAQPPRVVLVMAGDHSEFRTYLRTIEAGRVRRCRYVDRMEHVQGMRGAELVLVGRFEQNPLWSRINDVRAYIQE